MCNVLIASLRMWTLLLGYIITQAIAYPMQGWPVYPQVPREYTDDDYYYAPKAQYYYDTPAMATPEIYGQVPYPYYDTYGHFADEAPKRHEERLASLPIGQETWFENDATPRWQSNRVDDVSAAFLDNLILTQMAQDAQRRRENARAAFPPVDYDDKETNEDEDVRELKALAGKPLYHVPKTVPRFEEEEEEDYPVEDGFINWNGNKRSITTAAPTTTPTTPIPKAGQDEIFMPRPSHPINHENHDKRSSTFYDKLAQLMAKESTGSHIKESIHGRRIEKRFVAGDSDLVLELRGLKHRIPT